METSLQVLSIHTLIFLFAFMDYIVFSSYMGEFWLLQFVILLKLVEGMDFWLEKPSQSDRRQTHSPVFFFFFHLVSKSFRLKSPQRILLCFTNSLISLAKNESSLITFCSYILVAWESACLLS